MKLLILLVVGVVAGALVTTGAVLLGAGGSEAREAATSAQEFVIYVTGAPTDSVRGANLVSRADRPVRLTIVNDSPMAHTFTAPALGIEKVILPGKPGAPTTTTLTFRPHRGVYSWWCRLPCGDMGSGHMQGEIYALDNPPVMHGPLWAHSI